ncbi:MAG: hypothetical protein WAT66_08980 [Actinomycetota bacterium]
MRRIGRRVAAVVPLGLVASCSQQDVEDGIANAIKAALWFMAKMILISLGLLLAWAFAAALGGALIAFGINRRKADVPTVAAIVCGIAIMVGAWPLVFSDDGLAGVMAPGSIGPATAGPIVGQVLAVVGVVIAVIVLLKRRDKKKPKAPPATAALPPVEQVAEVEPVKRKAPVKRKTAAKPKAAAKPRKKTPASTAPRR